MRSSSSTGGRSSKWDQNAMIDVMKTNPEERGGAGAAAVSVPKDVILDQLRRDAASLRQRLAERKPQLENVLQTGQKQDDNLLSMDIMRQEKPWAQHQQKHNVAAVPHPPSTSKEAHQEKSLALALVQQRRHTVDQLGAKARQQEIALLASEISYQQAQERVKMAQEVSEVEGAKYERLELLEKVQRARERVQNLQDRSQRQDKLMKELKTNPSKGGTVSENAPAAVRVDVMQMFSPRQHQQQQQQQSGTYSAGDGSNPVSSRLMQPQLAAAENKSIDFTKAASASIPNGNDTPNDMLSPGSSSPLPPTAPLENYLYSVSVVPPCGCVVGGTLIRIHGLPKLPPGGVQAVILSSGKKKVRVAATASDGVPGKTSVRLEPTSMVSFLSPAWKTAERVRVDVIPETAPGIKEKKWEGHPPLYFNYHPQIDIQLVSPPAVPSFSMFRLRLRGVGLNWMSLDAAPVVRLVRPSLNPRSTIQDKSQTAAANKKLIQMDMIATATGIVDEDGMTADFGPTSQLGVFQVQVSWNGGAEFFGGEATCTVHAAPICTKMEPKTGIIGAKTPLIITTKQLHDSGSVKIKFIATDSGNGMVVAEDIMNAEVAGDQIHIKAPAYSLLVNVAIEISLDGGGKWFGGWGGLELKILEPPAVESFTPVCGPSTGGTDITLAGRGFIDTGEICLRITIGKMKREVPATFLSSTAIRCKFPSLRMTDGDATLSLSLNGRHFVDCPGVFTMHEPFSVVGIHPPTATMRGMQLISIFGGPWPSPPIILTVMLTLVNASNVSIRQTASLNKQKGVVEFIMPEVNFMGVVRLSISSNNQQFEYSPNAVIRISQQVNLDDELQKLQLKKEAEARKKREKEERARQRAERLRADDPVQVAKKALQDYYAANGETFAPQINETVPDFRSLQDRWAHRLAKRKSQYRERLEAEVAGNSGSKMAPFALRTDRIPVSLLEKAKERYLKLPCPYSKFYEAYDLPFNANAWEAILVIAEKGENVMDKQKKKDDKPAEKEKKEAAKPKEGEKKELIVSRQMLSRMNIPTPEMILCLSEPVFEREVKEITKAKQAQMESVEKNDTATVPKNSNPRRSSSVGPRSRAKSPPKNNNNIVRRRIMSARERGGKNRDKDDDNDYDENDRNSSPERRQARSISPRRTSPSRSPSKSPRRHQHPPFTRTTINSKANNNNNNNSNSIDLLSSNNNNNNNNNHNDNDPWREEEGDVYIGGRLDSGEYEGAGELRRRNGDVFRGNFHLGKPQGPGEWKFFCGDIFQGTFDDGIPVGEGSYFSKSGDVYRGEFYGMRGEGNGKKVWVDGRRYEGEWRAGVEHGFGIYTDPKGTRYEGEFLCGKAEGEGTLTTVDGSEYKGGWRGGREWGFGVCQWSDGRRYEGEWERGKRHGNGTFFYQDGSKYEGEWERGKRHGRGTFTWGNGSTYSGNWVRGEASGAGVYKMCAAEGGGEYVGMWQNNAPQGRGKFTHKGQAVEAEWKMGEIVKEGMGGEGELEEEDDDGEENGVGGLGGESGDEGKRRRRRRRRKEKIAGVGLKLQVRPRDLSVEVIDIAEESGAFVNGQISVGDVLIAVNGQGVHGIPLKNVANWLRGPSGSSVSVTFAKGGGVETETVVLTRIDVPLTVQEDQRAARASAYLTSRRLSRAKEREKNELDGEDDDDKTHDLWCSLVAPL